MGAWCCRATGGGGGGNRVHDDTSTTVVPRRIDDRGMTISSYEHSSTTFLHDFFGMFSLT
ncbi:hypothetical protein ANCCAN_10594 [Ancylostoma caninum]|uniref:Uncharacterized protein n=1 Tax=Ancylostoma caninum TaxID=29170 RepID=A0A368GG88_ANCCA|nr:hypothetical protein ANCCAN_10594 [Ancylostoma caninum]